MNPEPERTFETAAQGFDRLRAQLHDVASELRPLPSFQELSDRVHRVHNELQSIQQELQIVLHVARLEQDDIVSEVEKLERSLADGWVPESRPVEEVVADLRSKFG